MHSIGDFVQKISHPIQPDIFLPYKFGKEKGAGPQQRWFRTDALNEFSENPPLLPIINLTPLNSILRFVVADFDVPHLPGFDPSLIVNFAKDSHGTCKPFRGPKGDLKLLFAIRAPRFANFRARDALQFLNETLPPELRYFNQKAMTTTVANKNTWSDLYDAMNGRDFDMSGVYFGQPSREFFLIPSKFIYGVVALRSISLKSLSDTPDFRTSQMKVKVESLKSQLNETEKIILEYLLAHPDLGDRDGGMIPQAWYAKQIIAGGKARVDQGAMCRFLFKLRTMKLLTITDSEFVPGKKAKKYRFEGVLSRIWHAASLERTIASQTAHQGATYA